MSELHRRRWTRRPVRRRIFLPELRRWTGRRWARLDFWWRVQLDSRRP